MDNFFSRVIQKLITGDFGGTKKVKLNLLGIYPSNIEFWSGTQDFLDIKKPLVETKGLNFKKKQKLKTKFL